MQIEVSISLVGTVCAILSVAMLYFKSISSIDRRLTRLETKMNLFWKIVEREIPRLLKAPTHKEMDTLLDLLSEGELAKEDAVRLKGILEKEISGSCQDKVLACALVLIRVEQIIDGVDK